METFNKNTDYKVLLQLINRWEIPILTFYSRNNEQIEKLNLTLNGSLFDKQIEILYSRLNKINNSIAILSQTFTRSNESEENYFVDHEDWSELEHKVFYQYSIGNNPPLSFFKQSIEKVFEHFTIELKHGIFQGWEEIIKFEDSLETVSKYTLDSILRIVNNNTISIIEEKKYVENKLKELGQDTFIMPDRISKLIWKGTPAQFGFIVMELIGKGYLEKPTGSYNRDAAKYLDIFDIQGPEGTTTQGSLAKEISPATNSLSAQNGIKLKMPHIDKMK